MICLYGKKDCKKTDEIRTHLRDKKISHFFVYVDSDIPYLGFTKEILEKYKEEEFPLLFLETDEGYVEIKDYSDLNSEE